MTDRRNHMKKFMENVPNPDIIFQSWWPLIIAGVFGFLYGLRSWLRGPKCVGEMKLNNKTAIVTGSNSGIGKCVAIDLAKRGAKVIMACRRGKEGRESVEDVRRVTGNSRVSFMKLDLSSFKSIRSFVEKFYEKEEKLHILVNNAGVNMCPEQKSEDKFELHFAVNYLGTFLLTELLLDKLKSSCPSRIVNTAAAAAGLGTINFTNINLASEYTPGKAFAQSKMAILIYTLYLAEKLKGSGVSVNAVNPGVVNTGAHRHMLFRSNTFIRYSFSPFISFLMKTGEDGAQSTLFCCTAEELDGVSGKYFKDCQQREMDNVIRDGQLQERLYDASVEWTKKDKAV